ncbi:hypothetical protein F3Y22_tig00014673pilonHSYRG00006 [Hibiscus syriacus]|uniref:Uncharacterized protein n=1 Tax=Hibiscus syriacus TaxID=106335 RepID=A0A6A3AB38_HIBSY|nr:hypothetical protein F3Y22_tig00110550pilonHSYRG00011 [Hibiscus syriacus]KAE8721988.1 hypothetical protein F3Y22_tig00014673pilonHSYRG00006 [Hibiscus syriacus]
MFSNAGIMDRPMSTILDITKPEIEQVIGVNLVGALLGAKHAARNLAAELGQHGIRVNCISPYGVATPMIVSNEAEVTNLEQKLTEMGNLKGETLKPEGLAYAASYLASDEANFVSGIKLVLDGGFSIVNSTMMKAFYLIH